MPDETGQALFDDDADISEWARGSVYSMATNMIAYGVGDNKFASKNFMTEQEAVGTQIQRAIRP